MKQANPGVFIGIDGGGSKTTLVASAGVGRAVRQLPVGPTNPDVVGWALAMRRLVAGIRRLAKGQSIARITLGLAGIDTAADARRAQRALARALRISGSNITVVNDVIIGLAAGTHERAAAAFIAGTGSHAYARGPRGESFTTGFGPLLGDDGSGYMLGQLGIRAVLAARDGRGPATQLTARLQRYWRATNLSQLQDRVEQADKTTLAGSAPVVVTTAERGDVIARQLVLQASQAGAQALLAAIRQAGLRGSFPVVLIGSLFRSARYSRNFRRLVRQRYARTRFIQLHRSPAFGALRLSYAADS